MLGSSSNAKVVRRCWDEAFFVSSLLDWSRNYYRNFPWRKDGATPFEILIAEVLLQKTYSNKVTAVYTKLVTEYNNAFKLAKGDIEVIKTIVSPLGLQSKRAVALKEIGKAIVDRFHGNVPRKLEELLSLPWVGPYTANAVRCFAYGEREPIVDVNITRICTRYFGAKSKKHCRDIISQLTDLVPREDVKRLNYALLDFAALICKAKRPACDSCPISATCRECVKL